MTSATVDLYCYDLDAVAVPTHEMSRVLSAEELDRAKRFKLAALGRRYAVAHLLLRIVLAARLRRSPSELGFLTEPHGKPHLVDGPAFNIAHCESTLLIGVADGGRLGVDVERVRAVDALEELARQSLSAAEHAEWRGVPFDERPRAFLRAWTRKEAFVKAVGRGLSVPLGELSVSLAATDGNALRDASRVVADAQRWSIRSTAVRADAEAAVAWDRPHFDLRLVSETDAPLP